MSFRLHVRTIYIYTNPLLYFNVIVKLIDEGYTTSQPMQIYNKIILLVNQKVHDIGLYKRISQTQVDVPFGVLSRLLKVECDMHTERVSELLGFTKDFQHLSTPIEMPLSQIVDWDAFYTAKSKKDRFDTNSYISFI